ncbi:MAG: TIGR03620 family F420-dependent LLM class oxidoreductase [Candidatus Binataceae bacterium]
MQLGKIGVWAMLEAMTMRETLDFAKTIEKHGYQALWIPEGPGRDPFAHSAYLLSHTETLPIATGIANIWARDAIAMASAARTVAEISAGRFMLGIGVSHKPVVANRGHSYAKPYSYMKEYLPPLKDALKKPSQAQPQIPLLIAALHPKMLELAATETDGTHPYFVPPEHTAKVRAQIGPVPWICVEQAVILEEDPTTARAAARQHMSFYVTQLPNYRNNLKALGWHDFANGCSDRLVDAIVAWGSENRIRDRIQAHFTAGATHVCIQPLRADNQPVPDLRALQALAPA